MFRPCNRSSLVVEDSNKLYTYFCKTSCCRKLDKYLVKAICMSSVLKVYLLIVIQAVELGKL